MCQDGTDCQNPILSLHIPDAVLVIFLVTQEQIGPILADFFAVAFKFGGSFNMESDRDVCIGNFAIDLVTGSRRLD